MRGNTSTKTAFAEADTDSNSSNLLRGWHEGLNNTCFTSQQAAARIELEHVACGNPSESSVKAIFRE